MSLGKRNVDLQNQTGATMVEFAFAAILVFFLIALIFDGGMAVWRYSVLTEATAMVSVDRAIHVETPAGLATDLGVAGDCGTCDGLNACANAIGRAYTNRYTGVNGLTFEAQVDTVADPAGRPNPVGFIEVRGTWEVPCFFCPLVNRNIEITTAKSSPLEVAVRCD